MYRFCLDSIGKKGGGIGCVFVSAVTVMNFYFRYEDIYNFSYLLLPSIIESLCIN
jgi:hypothetical protein